MTLTELYARTPLVRHPDIMVANDRVYFDDEEFQLGSNGELRLLGSNKKQREGLTALKADLAAIKAKLGIA